MLFKIFTVLHILVLQTNSFNGEIEEKTKEIKVIRRISKSYETKSTTDNRNDYLNIIKNSRDAPNLISNVFDKMLSNEMLSIKHHLYEKDVKSSSVYLSFKNNVPTPTLEINQKWPIEKVISIISDKAKSDDTSGDRTLDHALSTENQSLNRTNTNKIIYKDNNLNLQVQNKHKIIEVRSFSVMPTSESTQHFQQAKRQCTCIKNNHQKFCSHHGIEAPVNIEKICTHTENYLTIRPHCTRTQAQSISLTYFPYFVYPSFFLGITNEDAYNTYYHPDIINNLKLPKHKNHKKTKKPYVEEAVFSDTDERKDIYDENQYDYSESDESEDAVAINKCPKNNCKLNSKLYHINYDNGAKGDSDLEEKIYNGYIKVIDNDKFVKDVIEDLKVYYNDAVIKDCYCSLSSFKYRSRNTFIYVVTILFLLWN